MPDMLRRGVLLAGGTGTRLLPLTRGLNKHLLPVGREPIIVNPLKKLVAAGISDVLVITGSPDMGAISGMLGDGSDFGIHISYRPQLEPGGTAQALALAEDFAHGERIVVALADTVGRQPINVFLKTFARQSSGARTLVRNVPDPQHYGIAEFRDGRISAIEERPKSPKGNSAILGYFMFDKNVFDFIRLAKVSVRGELEMTCVLNEYVKRSKLLYDMVSGDDWVDCGTFEGIERADKWRSDEC